MILFMILVNDRIYRAQEEKQVCFNRTVIGFILYFSSDVGWEASFREPEPLSCFLT